MTFISTGLSSVDDILGGGFIKGNVYVLSGAICMGKSAFALSILRSVLSIGNIKANYAALKQGRNETVIRLAMSDGQICNPYNNREEWLRLFDYISMNEDVNRTISDGKPSLTNEDMILDYFKHMTNNIDILIVDDLEALMENTLRRKPELTHRDMTKMIMKSASYVAKTNNSVIVMLIDAKSKGDYAKSTLPTVRDICNYGVISPYIKETLMLYRKRYYDINADKQSAQLFISKDKYAKLRFASEKYGFEC